MKKEGVKIQFWKPGGNLVVSSSLWHFHFECGKEANEFPLTEPLFICCQVFSQKNERCDFLLLIKSVLNAVGAWEFADHKLKQQ